MASSSVPRALSPYDPVRLNDWMQEGRRVVSRSVRVIRVLSQEDRSSLPQKFQSYLGAYRSLKRSLTNRFLELKSFEGISSCAKEMVDISARIYCLKSLNSIVKHFLQESSGALLTSFCADEVKDCLNKWNAYIDEVSKKRRFKGKDVGAYRDVYEPLKDSLRQLQLYPSAQQQVSGILQDLSKVHRRFPRETNIESFKTLRKGMSLDATFVLLDVLGKDTRSKAMGAYLCNRYENWLCAPPILDAKERAFYENDLPILKRTLERMKRCLDQPLKKPSKMRLFSEMRALIVDCDEIQRTDPDLMKREGDSRRESILKRMEKLLYALCETDQIAILASGAGFYGIANVQISQERCVYLKDLALVRLSEKMMEEELFHEALICISEIRDLEIRKSALEKRIEQVVLRGDLECGKWIVLQCVHYAEVSKRCQMDLAVGLAALFLRTSQDYEGALNLATSVIPPDQVLYLAAVKKYLIRLLARSKDGLEKAVDLALRLEFGAECISQTLESLAADLVLAHDEDFSVKLMSFFKIDKALCYFQESRGSLIAINVKSRVVRILLLELIQRGCSDQARSYAIKQIPEPRVKWEILDLIG